MKFWVYAGNQSTSKLVDGADLDGLGFKYVPQLCQVCHGGKPFNAGGAHTNLDYDLRTAPDAVGAVLREFDLAGYVYPGDSTPGNLGALSSDDLKAFYGLNQFVIASGTQPVMVDLINGFNPDDATFVKDWVPSGTGWTAGDKADLYKNVVGKSCRTCHIAFDSTATILGHSPNTLNWQDYPPSPATISVLATRSAARTSLCRTP